MKKIARLLLGVVVVAGLFLSAMPGITHASSKTDYANNEAQELHNMGILKGYPGGGFGLDRTIKRDEFAALVARTLDLKDENVENPFTDVPTDEWYYEVVYKAATAGIIKGFPDHTFRPEQLITREDMAVMIARMLDLKGVVAETSPLHFKDNGKINPHQEYQDAIKLCVALGIINGYPDNTFKPKRHANRAEAVVMIDRALHAIQKSQYQYTTASITKGGNLNPLNGRYATLDNAKKHVSGANQVVLKGNKIVWMKPNSGIVQTSGFTIIYGSSSLGSDLTYVSTGTEMQYLGSDSNSVHVKFADFDGYIKQSDAALIPNRMIENRSYYDVNSNGDLVHHVATGLIGAYVYGPAPKFMSASRKYYSWDGHTFYNASGNKVGTAYEYFDILPLHTKTSYDAADLNRYVKQNIPSDYKQAMGGDGPLARLGKYFIQAQNKYGVNALYLFAHAIHESAWGSSKIAQEKHNLFGLHATDTDTYDNATGFKSYQACINYAAKYVANKYQDPEGAYYYGAMLGNKQSGMNVKYASDPFWGQKIAGYMYRIDKALGGKDFGKYTLGVAAASSLNVHSTPHTGATIYQYKNPGAGIIITGTRKNGEGTWYQIYSDEHDFRNSDKVYVYHNGQYDLLSKKVNIAGK